MRKADIERITKETQIRASLNIDGKAVTRFRPAWFPRPHAGALLQARRLRLALIATGDSTSTSITPWKMWASC